MTPWYKVVFSVWLVQLSACMPHSGGDMSMTPTGGPLPPSRRPGCAFRIFTSNPGERYVEIGTIDSQFDSTSSTDLRDFYTAIQPIVCRSGGDAVVAYSNGFGYYIKATVLRAASVPSRRKAAMPVSTTVPAAPQATDLGCHYDTQCKGERICVEGRCTTPIGADQTAPATANTPESAHPK